MLTTLGAVSAAAQSAAWDAPAALRAAPQHVRTWHAAVSLTREARERETVQPEMSVALYLEAARRFEASSRVYPELAALHWRSARSYWLAANTLPLDDKDGRIEHFERAREIASRGTAADPGCAECMLWKFSAMGRLGTTRGTWTALRQASEMAELLDHAIASEPTYADSPDNSTLGNLHYASAIFYRVLPDWVLMSWIAGVRGDKERALAHARMALSIHGDRLDYRIEHGSQLLCLGASRGDPIRLAEGVRVMREAIAAEPSSQDQERDIVAGQIMLGEPRLACGYSGDTWVEIDRAEVMRAQD